MYIERTLQSTLLEAVRQFPDVVLTGPRQSGKTTLLKHLFGTHSGGDGGAVEADWEGVRE